MRTPTHKWRTLTLNQRFKVSRLIFRFEKFNYEWAKFIYPFQMMKETLGGISNTPSSIFISFFTGVFAFAILPILPKQPMSLVVSFGFGLSVAFFADSLRSLKKAIDQRLKGR